MTISKWDAEEYARAAQLYVDLEKIIASGKGGDKCESGIVKAYTDLVGGNQDGYFAPTFTYQELLVKVGQVKTEYASRLTFLGKTCTSVVRGNPSP